MTILSILDCETTGLDPSTDTVLQLGICLYHVESSTVIVQYENVIPTLVNPVEETNGIAAQSTYLFLPDYDLFQQMIDQSDYTVIHNAQFDTGFMGRNGMPNLTRPVICSMNDIRWRTRPNIKELIKITLAHGKPVISAHTALQDCSLLVSIFKCYSPDKLLKMIDKALLPKYLYTSLEGYPGTLSKEAGFVWKNIVPGKWARYIDEEDAQNLPFHVVKVTPEKVLRYV